MESSDSPASKDELRALREGIKNKYKAYHLLDRDRFPEFEYNTNRANYEPLRVSFTEEFFVVRGLERTQGSLHIPSTNTLALLFCDDSYLPGKKIFDTCRSYAEGKATVTSYEGLPVAGQSKTPTRFGSYFNWRNRPGLVVLGGVALLAGFTFYGITAQQYFITPFSRLIISYPANGRTVPRQLFAEGKATNASTVWLIVHPLRSVDYYVQPPIKVETNGTWKGILYIGSVKKVDIGLTFQLRGFAHPAKPLKEGDMLKSWPEAQLSSGAIEVIRGSEKESPIVLN